MIQELKGIHHLMKQEEAAFGSVELDGSGEALKDFHQVKTISCTELGTFCSSACGDL